MSPLKKKYNTKKISWLQCKHPSQENKQGIFSYMKDTFPNRRHWIKTANPNITEIFQKYPRLIDYNGEMINVEFQQMFDGLEDNFLTRFPAYYTPRIISYAKLHRRHVYENVPISNEHMRALIILAELLPDSNALQSRRGQQVRKGKGKKRQYEDKEICIESKAEQGGDSCSKFATGNNTRFLLQILPEGSNIQQFVESFISSENTNVQPFIVCVRGQKKDKYFIQGDRWFIEVLNKADPIVSFDLLFKLFYVLNLSYPMSLNNFFNFIDFYIFKTTNKPNSVVASMHVNIANCSIE
ncbi:uncharacterized protein LOC105202987 [Solenopsis invicta]|uniref:uncharacterized protein LOC105202987 n=1 Tax=Solenopsis invicta TaxID=13686 RepID=UPI00193D23A7|nr:uncharacterized protein LOC105202987 [Solenopsis invicta]